MPLSLRDSQVLVALAGVLYDLLPGSGNRAWRGHVTFASVADRMGLGRFWPGGSKLSAIQTLLELTLDQQRSLFEPLMIELVRAGIVYRQKKGNRLTAEELDQITGHMLELGFRCQQLREPALKSTLQQRDSERATDAEKRADLDEELRRAQRSQRDELFELSRELEQLATLSDRSAAGQRFEKLLVRLFEAFGLNAKGSFRVTGEEIDGSFELDHSVYLVEAKWLQRPVSHSELLIFHGKVGAKTTFTRGVFIALNGVSQEGRDGIRQGKQPAFFAMDGHDLMMILSGAIDLVEFLRKRRRLLDEQGRVFVAFQELS